MFDVWNYFTAIGATSLSIENTWSRNYKLGEDFTLSCYAREFQNDQHIMFVRLVEDNDVIISNGTALRKNVRHNGRYSVKLKYTDNTSLVASLTIRSKFMSTRADSVIPWVGLFFCCSLQYFLVPLLKLFFFSKWFN